MLSETFKKNFNKLTNRFSFVRRDVAEKTGIPLATINTWFARGSFPSESALEDLSKLFGIKPYVFFIEDDDEFELQALGAGVGRSEIHDNLLGDLTTVSSETDQLLLAILIDKISPKSKALNRFLISNKGESSKLLIQSQKIRLLELAQAISGLEYVNKEETNLSRKLSQLNPIQSQIIESAIDGILLSSAHQSKKEA
jgi:hypothetical protein